MSETRVIKKYPNRRLYDTAISSYITLADVKGLVLDGVDFQVVDAKTRQNITRSILLQIISEEEEGGEPIFSSELLAQLIRAYGGNMQNVLTSYLEKSLELWFDQQRMLQERTRTFMDHSPMNVLTQFAERNLSMWQAMSGLEPHGPGEGDEQEAPQPGKGKSGPEGDKNKPGGQSGRRKS